MALKTSARARKRLMRDFKRLQRDPPAGISAAPQDNNIMLWNAAIFGPDGTSWDGGTFELTLQFTEDYPKKPPTVRFVSRMFHPNIYADGSICLDILQNQWRPTYDVAAILISIQSLLSDPNHNSPANSKVAQMFSEKKREYNGRVREIVEQSSNTNHNMAADQQTTKKVGHVPYNFVRTSTNSEAGLRATTNTPILMNFVDCNSEERGHALEISHKDFLDCPLVDFKIVDSKFDAMIHQEFDTSFEEHCKNLRAMNIKPVMTHKINGGQARFRYVPQQYKSLIKEMLEFTAYLHKKKLSFASSLSLQKNLAFHEGVLKFHGFAARPATPDRESNDFRIIGELVLQLLGGKKRKLPLDMKNLVRMLEGTNSFELEFLTQHLALMTHDERLDFAKRCSEKEDYLQMMEEKKGQYQEAVTNIGCLKGWKNRFCDPGYVPAVKNCYCWPFASYVDDCGDDFVNNRSLLRCCRNLATHLPKHFCMDNMLFEEKDIDLIIMSLFGRELLKFQELLHCADLLAHFVRK